MVNPFDNNFFKFLLGFVCILVFSFALLFFIERYSNHLDGQSASLLTPK